MEMFCYVICYDQILNFSAAVEAPQLVEMFPAYYIFNGLLSILLVLHVIWTYFILKMAYFSVYAKEVQLHTLLLMALTKCSLIFILKKCSRLLEKPFSNLIPCFFSKLLDSCISWSRSGQGASGSGSGLLIHIAM